MGRIKLARTWLRQYRATSGVLSWEDIVAEELEKRCDPTLKLSESSWRALKGRIEEIAADQDVPALLCARARDLADGMNIHLW